MNHSKHTPGPWYADKLEDRYAYNIFPAGGTYSLMQVSYDRAYPARDVAANARLVAAAPGLLEALEQANRLLAELTFTDWITKKDVPSRDIRQRIAHAHGSASAAIAKATTAQPLPNAA